MSIYAASGPFLIFAKYAKWRRKLRCCVRGYFAYIANFARRGIGRKPALLLILRFLLILRGQLIELRWSAFPFFRFDDDARRCRGQQQVDGCVQFVLAGVALEAVAGQLPPGGPAASLVLAVCSSSTALAKMNLTLSVKYRTQARAASM
jgi:hypothetical protein